MSKILLLSDCHGNFSDLIRLQLEVIKTNLGVDLCIQVGDFGFYERCFGTLNKMNIKKFPLKTFAVQGNHEDHTWLMEQNHKEWEEKHNLFFKPKGSIEEIDGNIIAFLGCALNVDRAQEGSTNKRTTNYILDIEIHEALEKFLKYPQLDLMVTHTCPHSIGIGMTGSPIFIESITKFCHDKGHSTGNIWDCGDGPLTRLYRSLKTAGVKIPNWIFGHMHKIHYKMVDDTHFYCLGSSDDSDGTYIKHPFIYDTKTKRIDYHEKIDLLNSTGFHKTRLRD